MNLRRRLDKLEESCGVGSCPECGGQGRLFVDVLVPGQRAPKGGCPKCGLGTHIVIRMPLGTTGTLPLPPQTQRGFYRADNRRRRVGSGMKRGLR